MTMAKNILTSTELSTIESILDDYRYQLGFGVFVETDEKVEREIDFINGIIEKVDILRANCEC